LELTVQVKVGFIWINIPCRDNLGSCTYNNICAKLAKIDCPDLLKKYGIPCHCPFAKVTANVRLKL